MATIYDSNLDSFNNRTHDPFEDEEFINESDDLEDNESDIEDEDGESCNLSDNDNDIKDNLTISDSEYDEEDENSSEVDHHDNELDGDCRVDNQKYKHKHQSDCDPEISNNTTHKPHRSSSALLGLFPTLVILFLAILYMMQDYQTTPNVERTPSIKVNLRHVDEINKIYPNLLSPKEIRIIKTRLLVMQKEISVLMLLGKSKDTHCRLDPTFCVGRAIVNATQSDFGYVDASMSESRSELLEKELSTTFRGRRRIIVIDSLEKLPGSQVMSLFQYVDHDVTNNRKGMLLFILYTGTESFDPSSPSETADLAERILVDKWSPFIPKDTLSSVISRMCKSIIKVY